MRWIWIPLMVMAFALIARGDGTPDASKLVGSWKLPSAKIDEVVTYTKDGTFSQYMKMTDPDTNVTMSGTYKLDGNKLTETITKSNVAAKVGKVHTATVTSVTAQKLILQDGPEKDDEIELDRVNSATVPTSNP